MNRQLALAFVIATAAAGNAFADDITIDPTPFRSTMTRAEVLADLQQFRASGVDPWAQDYDQLASFRSERSRQEVSDEYIGERDTVHAFTGEDSGAMYMARRDAAPMPASHLAAAPADTEAE